MDSVNFVDQGLQWAQSKQKLLWIVSLCFLIDPRLIIGFLLSIIFLAVVNITIAEHHSFYWSNISQWHWADVSEGLAQLLLR